MRRLLRRAAWFLWMTPFDAALSIRLIASFVASTSAVPASAEATADFTRVLISDFTALLRSRRVSFCLLRLIWDLMFATGRRRYRLAGTFSKP